MKIIKLGGTHIALVDTEDYHRVIKFGSWARCDKRKRGHSPPNSNKLKRNILLHQLILNFPFLSDSKIIHHKNGRGWDCRKRNLALMSQSNHAKHHVGHNKFGTA